MSKFWKLYLFGCLCLALLCACGTGTSPVNQLPLEPLETQTASPTLARVEVTISPAVETPTTIPKQRLWIDPRLPAAVRNGVILSPWVRLVQDSAQADLRLSFRTGREAHVLQSVDWTYVLSARFPTIADDIPSQLIKQVWRGSAAGGSTLLMDEETHAVFSGFWGPSSGAGVHILPQDQLLDSAWQDPLAMAILPFENLAPRWKSLAVDGFSVLQRSMEVSSYPLNVQVVLSSSAAGQEPPLGVQLPPANRDASKLLTLTMTGTTALVRKTAELMNLRGVDYPARDIGALLHASDLTHVSNEVSFNQDCSPERAASGEGIFCSNPEYIRLLEDVGVDIVELTGNHNLDKGPAAYLYSLELFQARHWLTYGGGVDLAEARAPLFIQRGETRLAFFGCNMAGPGIAWAGPQAPGAATCDIDWLESQVRALRGEGILPVVTFQAFETEDYLPAPMQRPSDFMRISAAGAVVVSGSQAHFSQGFAFSGDGFIHYGLGNLFFDQVSPVSIRRSFIDQHIFYGDQYLGVQLITIELEDFGKPRLMTMAERQIFLADVFGADGW